MNDLIIYPSLPTRKYFPQPNCVVGSFSLTFLTVKFWKEKLNSEKPTHLNENLCLHVTAHIAKDQLKGRRNTHKKKQLPIIPSLHILSAFLDLKLVVK